MQEQKPTIGALPSTAKLVKIAGEYNETPYFIPGMTEDGEHTQAFTPGMTLSGYITGLRTTKNEVEKDRRDYLTMEDFSGNKFRVQAPGQLYGIAERLINEYSAKNTRPAVAITYVGKEWVEKLKSDCHQFHVQLVMI